MSLLSSKSSRAPIALRVNAQVLLFGALCDLAPTSSQTTISYIPLSSLCSSHSGRPLLLKHPRPTPAAGPGPLCSLGPAQPSSQFLPGSSLTSFKFYLKVTFSMRPSLAIRHKIPNRYSSHFPYSFSSLATITKRLYIFLIYVVLNINSIKNMRHKLHKNMRHCVLLTALSQVPNTGPGT